MSNANTLSGKNGKFEVDAELVARTTQWSVNRKYASVSEWGDSDSAGYTNRLGGRKDSTFTTEGKFDTSDEVYDLFADDDVAAAYLWIDGVSTTKYFWEFPRSICTDFSLSVNIDTGEVIGWTSSWGADGIFYYPGQSGASTGHTVPT